MIRFTFALALAGFAWGCTSSVTDSSADENNEKQTLTSLSCTALYSSQSSSSQCSIRFVEGEKRVAAQPSTVRATTLALRTGDQFYCEHQVVGTTAVSDSLSLSQQRQFGTVSVPCGAAIQVYVFDKTGHGVRLVSSDGTIHLEASAELISQLTVASMRLTTSEHARIGLDICPIGHAKTDCFDEQVAGNPR